MFVLRVLGRIELLNDEGHPVRSVLSQPKRVALLAYLAAAGEDGTTREALADLFWPTSDRERASHSVSQALYALRRSLGKNALRTEDPGRIVLDPARFQVDLQEFRHAMDEEDGERALELYRGELLEGLPLHDLAPFERWLDEERDRLRTGAREAADALSRRAEAVGRLKEACGWARRAVELGPYEERPLRRLLELLHAVGDRGGSLAEYERFEATLEADLGVAPSEETRILAHRIAESEPVPRGGPAGPTPPAEEPPEARSASPGADSGPFEAPGTGTPPRRSGEIVPAPARPANAPSSGGGGRGEEAGRGEERGPKRIAALAASRWGLLAGGVGAVLLAILLLSPRPEALPASSTDRVAVLPFVFHGSDAYEYLGEGVAELLSISLSGLEGMRTVDPRTIRSSRDNGMSAGMSLSAGEGLARRFGADYFVMGSILEAGGRIQVTASLYRTGPELIGSHMERAEDESELFEVVDDLVRHFLANEFLPRSTHLLSTAASTTHSLPALKSFLRGEQLFRTGRYPAALEAFVDAADLDESFALAHYRAAVTYLWTGSDDFEAAREWTRKALEHEDRLPDGQRLLIHALQAFLQGTGAEAEELYRRILDTQPENVEAWFNLGEVLFHFGPLMGKSVTASRAAWDRVLRFDPEHRGALVHMAAIAAIEEDMEHLERLVETQRALSPDGRAAPNIEALAAWGYDDEGAREALLHRLEQEPARRVRQAISYVARYLEDLDGAAEMASVLVRPERPATERAEGHLWLAHLALAAGRVEDARIEAAEASRLDPAAAAPFHRMLAAMPEIPVELWALSFAEEGPLREDPPGVVATEEVGVRLPRHGAGPGTTAPESYRALEVYLQALGEGPHPLNQEELRAAGDRIHELAAGSGHRTIAELLSEALRAEADLLEGRPGTARARLEEGLSRVELWYEMLRHSPLFSLARERYRLAELLATEGEVQEAVAWLDALVESSLGEIVYLVPSHLRRAELYELEGDVARAGSHYQRVLELWEGSDAPFQSFLDEVEARIELLAAGEAVAGGPPFP